MDAYLWLTFDELKSLLEVSQSTAENKGKMPTGKRISREFIFNPSGHRSARQFVRRYILAAQKRPEPISCVS
jgi:hypothetical protein